MSRYTEWYHRDIERSRRLARVKSRRKLQKLVDLVYAFKAQPCTDCRVVYPYWIMDMDHVRGVKVMDINGMLRGWGRKFSEVEDELAKCEPVCSNCHRNRTYWRIIWRNGESWVDRLPNFV